MVDDCDRVISNWIHIMLNCHDGEVLNNNFMATESRISIDDKTKHFLHGKIL
jgi:hypothetical protein